MKPMKPLIFAPLLACILAVCAAVVPASAQTFNFNGSGRTGSVQTFTAPAAGIYHIVADGASGGAGSGGTVAGGLGAEIGGDFILTAGQVLNIYVGGSGANGAAVAGGGAAGGGGGGSFVV